MRKPQSNQGTNLLDLIPERRINSENEENGAAVLLVPKFRRGILAKILQPRIKRPYFRVRLDVFGSHIWNHCDGSRNVKELADGLREAFGDKVEPVYERAALFIQSLIRNGFVVLKSEASDSGEL